MKKLFLIVSLIVLFAMLAFGQSDAGFLEGPFTGQWACLHANGSFWAWTPYTDEYTYSDAVSWCAAHGYSW